MSPKVPKATIERQDGPIRVLDGNHKVSGKNHDESLMRHLASAIACLRCPHCESIVYTRRHKLCGVCGEALPDEFLFSREEAQRLESLMRNEQRRHRQWMTKTFSSAVAAAYWQG